MSTSAATDCAWLVYGDNAQPSRARYKCRPWTERRPIGVKVLSEVMDKAGVTHNTCSPRYPHPSVVLVSFTSSRDIRDFYRETVNRESWRKRTFRVVAGGYGLQAPHQIRGLVDYAFFGRAESDIVQLIADATAKRPNTSPHVMNLRDDIHPVTVRQATALYEGEFRETFQGCPLKCKFCHYTFARKHKGGDHAYSRTAGTAGAYVQTTGHTDKTRFQNSIELTWPQLLNWPHDRAYTDVTVGLDGPSERLRFLYGKRIADHEIPTGIERYAEVLDKYGYKGCKLKVYDIAGFPGETDRDRQILRRQFQAANPIELPGNMLVVVSITPFRPSAWTPMQWEAASMDGWRAYSSWYLARKGRYRAMYSRFIPGRMATLEGMAIRHDGSEPHQRAWHALCTHPAFRNGKDAARWLRFRSAFPSVYAHWTGAHEVGAPLASQLARSWTPPRVLEKIARQMRSDAGRSAAEPEWRRGTRTVAGNPVVLPTVSPAPEGAPACA